MSKSPDKTALELLAPAGNAQIGIAAIDHGADAVYIGAPRFSARADAGVGMAEIERLISHAHPYYAKVYVALNTILRDDEISEALKLIREIYGSGADGLIIQDPGLLQLDLPPIPLIASTQMHNATPEKIRFLEEVGFKRAILARELSLNEIAAIRQETRIELECFVHGALCVSYSGQCYMSEAVAGRSGNRGVCAQPCRSRYTLVDGDGNTVVSEKFLLSLRDLNLMHEIPELAAAGITSFKIEGRYKEIDYVKNVTAAYRLALDAFIRDHPEYRRSSSGKSEIFFRPDTAKTFNRGFTQYFISGRKEKVASINTPKSIGQLVGTIVSIGKGFFKTDCPDIENGDGLCFFTKGNKLTGFRVDRVEDSKIFPNSLKDLEKGISLYRNYSIALDRILRKTSGSRKILVEMELKHLDEAVHLVALDEDGNKAALNFEWIRQEPRDPSKARVQIEEHMSSTGNTPFRVRKVIISGKIGFMPVSFVNRMRRDILAELTNIRLKGQGSKTSVFIPNNFQYPERQLDFRANVFNEHARSFYRRHGAEVLEPAFESLSQREGREVMSTKYCIRHELDQCPKYSRSCKNIKEPLRLVDAHHQYLLKFDCKNCRMSVIFLGKK